MSQLKTLGGAAALITTSCGWIMPAHAWSWPWERTLTLSGTVSESVDCATGDYDKVVVRGRVVASSQIGPDAPFTLKCPVIEFAKGSSLVSPHSLRIVATKKLSGWVHVCNNAARKGSDATPTPELWAVYGGNSGPNGSDGASGADARTRQIWKRDRWGIPYPSIQNHSADAGEGGRPGERGENGKAGGKGAPGGAATAAQRIVISTPRITSDTRVIIEAPGAAGGDGGKGGRGWNGGDGGNGGNGGKGGDGNSVHGGKSGGDGGRGGSGGNGGNAGDGGDGGDGSAGGNVSVHIWQVSYKPSQITAALDGGRGGAGGHPGEVGSGGNGGSGGLPGCGGSGGSFAGIRTNSGGSCGTNGSKGTNGGPGSPGSAGQPGRPGENGKLGSLEVTTVRPLDI